MNDNIVLFIGSSTNNVKKIEIPDNLLKEKYTITLEMNPFTDKFSFVIDNKLLIIKRLDNLGGWNYNHSVIFTKIIL